MTPVVELGRGYSASAVCGTLNASVAPAAIDR